MKKRLISVIIAGVMLTTAISGCGKTAGTGAETQAVPEAAQETSAADTGSAGEGADEKSSYAPASFRASDVYVAPEQVANTDISGCDTFTQIVDKLQDGKGYANVTFGDTDVLLVASGTYQWETDQYAAIDSEVFYYNEGVPAYLATYSAGGTAYPLAVKDGNLYVGGNHFMCKYRLENGFIIPLEEAYVKYDTDGNATYYYKTCNSQFEDYDAATAESRFNELFTEEADAEVINFQPVGGTASES